MAQPSTEQHTDHQMQNNESGNNSSGTGERRGRLKQTIESLVNLRQEVVVSYCKLIGVSSFEARFTEAQAIQPDQLRKFCQIMVDYTAMGHFELYQRIIEGKERRQAVKDIAARVYPGIAETTDFLVDFNDKYDAFEGTPEELELLGNDLGKLGEMLTTRGELEDQILAALGK